MAEGNGFFDFLSDVGTMASFATNPVGTTISTVGREIFENKQFNERNEAQMAYQDPFSTGTGAFGSQPSTATAGSSGGFFGGLGQTLGGFGRDVGQFVTDISPLTSLFGIGGGNDGPVPSGAKSVTRMGAQETATSGEILGANLGMAGGLVQAARGFARSPVGQGLIGGAAGTALVGLGDGANGAPRITRRMKADVRKVYMMAGMDPNLTANIMNNLGTYPKFNFNASLIFLILTKRFRNDGPVVTKAAVRKTKTTLRRMKGVVDMYNSVCKPTTRRAPTRRAAPKAVQLIKN